MNPVYDSLPKKRMAAGAFFRNESEEVLLVKPHYKNHWDIPGGIVEARESPFDGCKREIAEEIGLEMHHSRLLCLDYVAEREDSTEGLIFIYDGGVLDAAGISRISLQQEELTDFAFVLLEEAASRLTERMFRRIGLCADAVEKSTFHYTENQKAP